jgi:hypothetical protein
MVARRRVLDLDIAAYKGRTFLFEEYKNIISEVDQHNQFYNGSIYEGIIIILF